MVDIDQADFMTWLICDPTSTNQLYSKENNHQIIT